MTKIENESIRQLPDNKGKIFESCYQSPSYIFVSTDGCPKTVFNELIRRIDVGELSWLKPLRTSTSRELFLGQLDDAGFSLPDIIFKKSRFAYLPTNSVSFQPGTASNEIRSNLLLSAVVQKQIKSEELPPPDGFESLAVRVEQPLGILVDKRNKSKYTVFEYEKGYDFGEILQYTDPPMQGAVNYKPRDWKIFCGIKDVLERIAQTASRDGLTMQDYDIHQVLYRTDEQIKSLELLLIDTERFRIDCK